MRIESDGHSQGNPRLYELIEHAPKTGKSPTVWAWPELIDYLKIAGQPVAGPWPPHQEPRPDPDDESLPVAVPDPEVAPRPAGAPSIRVRQRTGATGPVLSLTRARPAVTERRQGRTLEDLCIRLGSATRHRVRSTRRSACCATAATRPRCWPGGQSLVPLMKLRFASPELLVDINNIRGLDYHRADADGTLRIGALCRHADLEHSALLKGNAADHGRGRTADRRPDRAQPGHAGRLAVPRRPAGRLGLGGDRAGRLGGGAGPGRQAQHPHGRLRHRAVRERAGATTRSRSRPSSRRTGAPRRAATSSWSAGSATSPRSGWRSPWRPPAGP